MNDEMFIELVNSLVKYQSKSKSGSPVEQIIFEKVAGLIIKLIFKINNNLLKCHCKFELILSNLFYLKKTSTTKKRILSRQRKLHGAQRKISSTYTAENKAAK